MTSQFGISVVIPTFNSSETITKTIQSVLQQTVIPEKFEILVVDDGSQDDTKKVVKKIVNSAGKVQINLLEKTNGGVSSARNYGIRQSKYEWIMFLDSDDIWINTKIESQLQVLEKHPDIDFLGGNVTPFRTKIPFIGELPSLYRVRPTDLLIKWVPQTSTVVVRKNVLFAVGLYDEEMKYAEDGDLYIRIAEKYEYYVQQMQLVDYGYGKMMFGESGLSGNLKGMFDGNIRILLKTRQRRTITKLQLVIFWLWNVIKYARRIVIVLLKKIGR